MTFAKKTFIILALMVAGAMGECEEIFRPLSDLSLSDKAVAENFAAQMEKQTGVRAFNPSGDFRSVVREIISGDLSELKAQRIPTVDALKQQIAAEATSHFQSDKAADPEVLMSRIARVTSRYMIGACPVPRDYNAALAAYKEPLVKYFRDNNKDAAFQNDFNKRGGATLIAELTKYNTQIHAFQCMCRGPVAAATVFKGLQASVDSITSGKTKLAADTFMIYVDRLAAIGVPVIQADSAYLGIIAEVYGKGIVDHLGNANAPAHVHRFALKLSHELLKEAIKDSKNAEAIKKLYSELVYKAFAKVNGSVFSMKEFTEPRLEREVAFDFSSPQATIQSRSLLIEILLSMMSKDAQVDLTESQLAQVTEKFQDAFDISYESLRALGATDYLIGSVSFFDSEEGEQTAEAETAKAAFLDVLNKFFATKPLNADAAHTFTALDQFLDEESGRSPVAEHYQLFKLFNGASYLTDNSITYTMQWKKDSSSAEANRKALRNGLDDIFEALDKKGAKGTLDSYEIAKFFSKGSVHESTEVVEGENKPQQISIAGAGQVRVDLGDVTVKQEQKGKTDAKKPGRDIDEGRFKPYRKFGKSYKVTTHSIRNCNVKIAQETREGEPASGASTTVYQVISDAGAKEVSAEEFERQAESCRQKVIEKYNASQNKDAQDGSKKKPSTSTEEPSVEQYTVTTSFINGCQMYTDSKTHIGVPQKNQDLKKFIKIDGEKFIDIKEEEYWNLRRACESNIPKTKSVTQTITGCNIAIHTDTYTGPLPAGVEAEYYFSKANDQAQPKALSKEEFKALEAACQNKPLLGQKERYIVVTTIIDEACGQQIIENTIFGAKPEELRVYYEKKGESKNKISEEQFNSILWNCQHPKEIDVINFVFFPGGRQEIEEITYYGSLPADVFEKNYFKMENGERKPISEEEYLDLTAEGPSKHKGEIFKTIKKVIERAENGYCEIYTLELNTSKKAADYEPEVYFVKTSAGESKISKEQYAEEEAKCKSQKKPEPTPSSHKEFVSTKVTIDDKCVISLATSTKLGAEEGRVQTYFTKTSLGDVREVTKEEYEAQEKRCLEPESATLIQGKETYSSSTFTLDHCSIHTKTTHTTIKPAEEFGNSYFGIHNGETLSLSKEDFFYNWSRCKEGYTEEIAISLPLDEPVTEVKKPEIQPSIQLPTDDAIVQHRLTRYNVNSDCTYGQDSEIVDGHAPEGTKFESWFKGDSRTGERTEISQEEYNKLFAECVRKLAAKANFHAPREHILHLLRGDANTDMLEGLAGSPELFAYIKQNPTLVDEQEDSITEYVFVEVAREDAACYAALE